MGPGSLRSDNLEAFLVERERLLMVAIAGVTGAPLQAAGNDIYLDPSRPFTNELALRGVIRGLHGRAFWYEARMGKKVLEPVAEEINRAQVHEIRLLSGPANVNDKTKRAFERFTQEMNNDGIECAWRVLPAEAGRDPSCASAL